MQLEINYTHQVGQLTYADVVNLIGDDIRAIERNADVLLKACKDIGLAVKTGKTKYMEVRRHRGMMVNKHITVDSNSYQKVKTFKYLGSVLTYQNFILKEIKCRLKTRNSCYYSVQTLFSCRLLSENYKLKYIKQ